MATASAEVAVARIDFTRVGCIDYSCADEIVAKLLQSRPRVLVLMGISDGHREAIEPVLAGHRLAVLIERPAGTPEAVRAPDAAAAPLGEPGSRRVGGRTPRGSPRP